MSSAEERWIDGAAVSTRSTTLTDFDAAARAVRDHQRAPAICMTRKITAMPARAISGPPISCPPDASGEVHMTAKPAMTSTSPNIRDRGVPRFMQSRP